MDVPGLDAEGQPFDELTVTRALGRGPAPASLPLKVINSLQVQYGVFKHHLPDRCEGHAGDGMSCEN